MKFSLSQAANEVGVNKATLSRWRKDGKFSAEKQPDGSYQIDASELNRIKDLKKNRQRRSCNETPETQQPETSENNLEINILHVKLDALQEQLNREREINDDLKDDRDKWREQAKSSALLLTHHQEQETRQKAPQGRVGRAWAALTGKL